MTRHKKLSLRSQPPSRGRFAVTQRNRRPGDGAQSGYTFLYYKKLGIIFLSGIAVAAMVLLPAGLSDIELLPGQPFYIEAESQLGGGEFGPLPGGEFLLLLARAFFALALLSLPFLIIYFIISPEFRKRVLRMLVSLLWICAFYIVLTRVRPDLFDVGEGMRLTPSQGQPLSSVPAADFVANPSRWFTLVAALGLAVLLAALLVGTAWFIWRRIHRPASPLEQLAQQARDALESLRAGDDLKNTVIRCYFEMVRVLDEQRGIKRQMDMTPREFEIRLESVGLPDEHVRGLTRLFEAVRYGAKDVGENEERRAVACLTAIVEACEGSL